MIVNVPDVTPPGIVTEPGTVATPLLDERLMTIPEAGAGPDKVTYPVADVPPTTALGPTAIDARTGAVTVSVAVTDAVPMLALIVTGVEVATEVVVTVNVPVDCPAAMVIEFGTDARPVLLLESVTICPANPAEPTRVTVPVDDVPPGTVAGFTETDFTVTGVKLLLRAYRLLSVDSMYSVPSPPITGDAITELPVV